MPRDPLQSAQRAAALLTRVLVALAVVAMCPAVHGQVPHIARDAYWDNFAENSKMGLALAARGERSVFSGGNTIWGLTWFVFRSPNGHWAASTSGWGADAVALDNQAVLVSDGSVMRRMSWVDGSPVDFSSAQDWNGCFESVALAGKLVRGCASDNGNRGLAEVVRLEYQNGTWLWNQELVRTGAVPGTQLGAAVVIGGNTVAFGQPNHISGATGQVSVHRSIASTWYGAGTLQAADLEPGNAFGAALALSGDWLAVGAPLDDSSFPFPMFPDVGIVHLYKKNSLIGGFTHMASLHGASSGDNFGSALAMTETTLVVGAPMANSVGIFVNVGRAYVFRRGSGGLWTYVARLGASGPYIADRFGTSVGIIGDDVLVGAPGRDGANVNSGAVYLFSGLIPFFADGFESGSTSGWSSSVP